MVMFVEVRGRSVTQYCITDHRLHASQSECLSRNTPTSSKPVFEFFSPFEIVFEVSE